MLPHVSSSVPSDVQQHYRGLALLADPIHAYIPFTVPLDSSAGGEEITEKDLIDTPWIQRLRYINQLQSARWVFPGAEHSRFQHSLGAMHVAGRFARQLYPSLQKVVSSCPSLPYVEALLRVSALLHDVGHGPFGHFFDANHLAQYGIGHEAVGQQIILRALGSQIRGIRRSPSGPFAPHEVLEPEYVAYVMQKKAPEVEHMPRWLRYLKPVLSGVYTADNLDYVLRDAYMCGVAIGPVDLERLLHYSVVTPPGLTLHQAGLGALTMFLTARLYLYTHVYFHRTTRALDLHLREIFPSTMHYIFPGNPLMALDRYLRLTDWSLLEAVRNWQEDPLPVKQALGVEWNRILQRQVKWKMAYDATLSIREYERRTANVFAPEALLQRIRQALPATTSEVEFRLDIATQDERRLNPLTRHEWPVHIYDPATNSVRTEHVEGMLQVLPEQRVQYRLYTTDSSWTPLLAHACENALGAGNETPVWKE